MQIIILALFILFTGFPISGFSQKGTVTIELEGIKNSKGTIRIGVYNKSDQLWKKEGVVKNAEGKINQEKSTVEIDDLPYGDYAFAILHDENDNKEMDYTWLGLPEEGFGFSKNPKVSLSAPSFEDTKINLNTEKMIVKITMKYM